MFYHLFHAALLLIGLSTVVSATPAGRETERILMDSGVADETGSEMWFGGGVHDGVQQKEAEAMPIPGGTTFHYCDGDDGTEDIFQIEKLVWEPYPPRISRDQKLLLHGIFTHRIPPSAMGTGEIKIPEWHDPYSPASNYTDVEPFCAWPNYIYQYDERRGSHKVCDGKVGGNSSSPEAGKAVLVAEDMLFNLLPEGEYGLRLDVRMPGGKDDVEGGGKNKPGKEDEDEDWHGERIFCFEGKVNLDY